MMRWLRMGRRPNRASVEFDEILLDSSNLPSFNSGRLEGRLELPILRRNVYIIGAIFTLVALAFLAKLFQLQVVEGARYATVSQENQIGEALIIAPRGVVYDRNDELLIWNERDAAGRREFPVRAYTDHAGLGSLLGFVSYPQKDKQGFYYRTEYLGRNGIEQAYDDLLRGDNGRQILEINAVGERVGEHETEPPQAGEQLTLSIDAELSQALHDIIATSSAQAGFQGGAGAIMNVHTGEIIAMSSFPSYDPEVMADGEDEEQIESYSNDPRFPFLNKVVAGEYTPGSVVKPFVAYAALAEEVIDPDTTIESTGELVVPDRYNPDNPSRFTDWRAHGEMTMQEGIAFSSNVYFYQIGGGYDEQDGVGITKLADYFSRFGFGTTTGIDLPGERAGIVPTPAWKEETFADDWRLGDTYLTSVGQFGWQVTPLQMLRAYGGLATGGAFVTPHVVKGEQGEVHRWPLDEDDLAVVHEGMHMTTYYPGGTARGLERDDVAIAAKSGTAEVGSGNQFVNSWAAGFWPLEDPQYSFILMMERAPRENTLGATTIMGDVVDWIADKRPEYLGLPAADETISSTD